MSSTKAVWLLKKIKQKKWFEHTSNNLAVASNHLAVNYEPLPKVTNQNRQRLPNTPTDHFITTKLPPTVFQGT